jgi:serine/threonine protein kinase
VRWNPFAILCVSNRSSCQFVPRISMSTLVSVGSESHSVAIGGATGKTHTPLSASSAETSEIPVAKSPLITKLDANSKIDLSGKSITTKASASIVASSSNESLAASSKPSKSSELKSSSGLSIVTVVNNPNSNSAAVLPQYTTTTGKTQISGKKKKDISLESATLPKNDHLSPLIMPPTDSTRPMSPPKAARRKSAKSFTRSASGLASDPTAISRDVTPGPTHANTPSIPTNTHSTISPSNESIPMPPTQISLASASTSSSPLLDEHPKRKTNSKKRKSVKDLITSSIFESDRDQSPLLRSSEDKFPSSSIDHSQSSSSVSSSHTQATSTSSLVSECEVSGDQHTTPAHPKMRKSTSSTFKDSIVSLLTSPVKKKYKKGEESDGERDDKVVSKEAKEIQDSKEALGGGKDGKEKDKDGKESKDSKEKDGKDKDKDVKDAKEGEKSKESAAKFSWKDVKEKDSKDKEKDGKDKESKEKDKEKDSKEKEKDSKESKDKEKEGPSTRSTSSIIDPSSLSFASGGGGGGHIVLNSSSTSFVTHTASPLTVTFAKKPKKLKKKTGAGGSKRKTKICFLQTIPVEILLKLLCCLDVTSLMHMGMASKLFKGICKEPFVWHVVAVKMMRAGQRKPRVFEWHAYAKSIWCFRRGLSLDVEAFVEHPLNQEFVDSVDSANKRLSKPHNIKTTDTGATSRLLDRIFDAHTPSPTTTTTTTTTMTYAASSSSSSSSTPLSSTNSSSTNSSVASSSMLLMNSVETSQTHSKDGTNKDTALGSNNSETHVSETGMAHAAAPYSNGISSSTTTSSSAHLHQTVSNPSQSNPSNHDDPSDSTMTAATSTADNVSTSEDISESLSVSVGHHGVVSLASYTTTPQSVSALTLNGNNGSGVVYSASSSFAAPSGIDVYVAHLLNILSNSNIDLQTDLSLRYPFLFTDDDGLELRLCVTMPSLFKVKQTLASTPHLVLRSNHLPTREMVTIVKIPYVPGMRPQLKTSDLKLTHFLRIIECPYLVSYYGCYFDGRHIWYVSEYCSGGSCRQRLDGSGYAGAFTETEMAWLARDVLRGLVVLHKHGFVHGNISASAFMLTELRQGRSVAKLRVKTLLNALEASRSISSTLLARKAYWRAPEGQVSPAMDIWSIGMTFIELAEGRPPGWNLPPAKARNVIVNSPPPSLRHPTSFTAKFRTFLDHCLVKDPNNRPTALQLLSHPFIVDNVALPKKLTSGPTSTAARVKLTRFNSSPLASTSSSIVSGGPRSGSPAPPNDTARNNASATTSNADGGPRRTRKGPTPSTSKTDLSQQQGGSNAPTRRGRTKKTKQTETAKATGSQRAPKITRRLSYAGSASTSDTMTHPYLSDSEDNISFALTHSSSRMSFSWSEDWASGSVDVSMDSKH